MMTTDAYGIQAPGLRTTCSTVMSLPSRELPKLDWKSVAPAWRSGWFIEMT